MTDFTHSLKPHFEHAASDDSQGQPAVSSEQVERYDAAAARLRAALDQETNHIDSSEIAAARLELRDIAVKLRDCGFWRKDKQGLRETVALLWRADRHFSDQALSGSDTIAG